MLIIVTGPTAVGKTDLSIRLAKHFKTEIISCDSRQIYTELNIGTAKPSKSELDEVPHHFINHKSIHDSYTAKMFSQEASQLLDSLFHIHATVIMTGGTGLYIKALIEGLDEFPEVSSKIINSLNLDFEEHGIEYLQNLLKEGDPDYYDKVDLHNSRRLIRALSVIKSSGKPYSSFLNKKKKELPFDFKYFVLNRPRAELYERINKRVDQMMEDGLLDEVKNLIEFQELSALKTVGYQELFPYIKEEVSYEHAVDKIKQHTRNYAKRQLTWFRKIEYATLLESNQNNFEQILKIIK